MKVTIFGATGNLGGECLKQALSDGHEVTLLVRTKSKLDNELQGKCTVLEGNGLNAADVNSAIPNDCDAILFAIGVDKQSPEHLCAMITENIIAAMRAKGVSRFVWCGGGATLLEGDQLSFGARFVEFFSRVFMALRHRDKLHQLEVLGTANDVDWIGIRPLQMFNGPLTECYRLGYDSFSGMSKISFADCAHAMLLMMNDDSWIRKAPIVQY
ncbi:MAG: NAD(P)-dependent oxidoreductase [Pseudomonadales bacterium]